MPFRITPTRAAATQIRNESAWWRRNRTKAPHLFRDELRSAFALIAEYPDAGAPAEDVDLAGVRRIILAGTQHFVYYRVNPAAQLVEILAMWSTRRGEPPPMRIR
ncbi:MAG TPA: type II toxin-antitoxin system RelE/ParE family toxin [Thermoanaerobaculia bacterium]|nr:type II toxin-antitoxin system RelE/ParE family toxin [Thermoanaerobaculia bacterium]